QIAARLVTHLAIRTNHVRSVFSSGMNKMIDEMTVLLSDPTKMRELLGVDSTSPIENISTPISKAFDDLPLEKYSLPPALSKRIMAFHLRELFDKFYSSMQPDVSQKIFELAYRIPVFTRDAHNRALLKIEPSS